LAGFSGRLDKTHAPNTTREQSILSSHIKSNTTNSIWYCKTNDRKGNIPLWEKISRFPVHCSPLSSCIV